MSLLPDLTIENYRLFQNFELGRLARINLIAGRNNVGKSALLEAAYLIGSQNPRDALDQILRGRGEHSRSQGWMLKSLFYDYRLDKNAIIEIKTADKYIKIYIPDPDEWESIFERFYQTRKKDFEDEIVIPIRIEHPEENKSFSLIVNSEGNVTNLRDLRLRRPSLWANEPERVYRLQGTDSLYERYKELSSWWDKISLTTRADTVIEILKIIEPTLEDLVFLSQQNNIKISLDGAKEPVFISSLGDGMHHLLMIAVNLVNAQDGLLLLDEIETGLHYSVLVDLWRLFFNNAQKLNAQIIATTHSWDCIAAFSQVWSEMDEKDGLYCRLDRINEQIIPEFYSPDELAFAVREEIETR